MTPLIFTSERDASDCVQYWQRQLRLSDWVVEVKILRGRDMSGPGRAAECNYHLESKSATIHLLDPVDQHPLSLTTDRDHEICIVHELLHLHVAPFDPQPDTLQQKMSEVAIESTAQALVRLNRGIRL